MMQTSVVSSNIAKLGWANETLFILFNSGKVYAYPGVSAETYGEMVHAPSVGKFFHAEIKNRFADRPPTLDELAVMCGTNPVSTNVSAIATEVNGVS